MNSHAEDEDNAIVEAITAAATHNRAGRFKDAASIYNKVLSLSPSNLDALKGMAELAARTNEPHSALPFYAKILHENPDNPDALNNRGVILMSLGDAEASEFSFRKLLKLFPEDLQGLNNLGNNLVNQKRFDEAEEQFLKSIDSDPEHAAAYYNLGVLYTTKSPNDHKNQLKYFTKTLEVDPDFTDAHINIANIMAVNDNPDMAILHLDKALLGRPNDGVILFNKGLTLRKQCLYKEALDAFQAARGNFPEPYRLDFETGNTHYELGDLKKAAAFFMTSISERASFKKGFLGLGKVLAESGQISKAKEAFERACNEFEVQQRQKTLDILTGDRDPWVILKESFENDFLQTTAQEFKWRGEKISESLSIHTTGMALGEIILLSRLTSDLLKKTKEVNFITHPSLVSVLQRVVGVNAVSNQETFNPDKLNSNTKATHLYAVPSFLKLTNGELPESTRYITPNIERGRLWNENTFNGNEIQIGLNWSQRNIYTGPDQDLIFEEFEPIIKLQGAAFTNLTSTSNETLKGHMRDLDVLNISEFIRDYDDLLTIIDQLDLLVTTDSLTAHLAGALGKPTIVLLPLLPNWCWGYKTIKSSYYPNHTLIRQSVENNWDRPIQRTITFLRKHYGLS